jgi:threonine dehydrogenase-like Zn-dependent dehydrogenase
LWGANLGGCFGYSHAMGGSAGSHADYIRVPYADIGGADLGNVQGGDVVAVWGAGAVGQMAARAAMLLGAEQVIVIDRFDYRLESARRDVGCETLNYEQTDVSAELKERTGGRGPDVCIEAVGMEAHSDGPAYLYDQVKQQLRLQTHRPTAVREAIDNCRKAGTVFVLGVYGGFVDKFPLGAVINKGLTVRGAQQHGQRYIPLLLERMERGELVTEHLATHTMPLSEGPRGYRMFKAKTDQNIRSVFVPGG